MSGALSEVATVAFGELRSLLRDGHTLAYSIALPLFLYPALFIGVAQVVTIARGAEERRVARVALLPEDASPRLAEHLAKAKGIQVVPLPAASGVEPARAAGGWIRKGLLDAVAAVRREGDSLEVDVLYSEARDASRGARERLERALEGFRESELRRKATEIGADENLIWALDVEAVDITPHARRARDEVARVVPLLLLLMTAVGAFYPALDATVGERERGTLETTLLGPVGRTTLVLGKFLPVVGFAALAAVLNFLSMGLAVWFFLLQARLEAPPVAISAGAVATTLASASLAALLLGALMMGAALFARSFKEGQSYLGPVMLLALLPGLAATVPEIRLTPALAAVPVLNLALAVRDAIQERLDPALAAVTFLSSAAATAAVVLIAGRMAGRETVLLGEPARGPRGRGLARLLLGRR